MATTNYSLRIDESDKQKAEQVFKSLGMTFSTGINIYLKTVGRQQKIPFELTLDEQMSTIPVPRPRSTHDDKESALNTLIGILAEYDIDLDKEREERISRK